MASADHKRISETCKVLCLDTGKSVDAVVLEFKENQKLTVVINKSIKLYLNWNGKQYLGKSSGLEFTTEGPTITTYKINAR